MAIPGRPIQRRTTIRGPFSVRWTTFDWAASITLSALWHLLVLAVLALTYHPFELPDQNRAVEMEILPPLTPPPTPTIEVQLRPRQADETKPPVVRPSPPTPPPKPVEAPPQPAPIPAPAQAPAVEARPAPPPLQTQRAPPQVPEAPPEPVEAQRQAPVLPPQVEAPRAQAPAPKLDTSRVAPALPQPAAPEAPAAPSQVQVLTNQNVVQAPVEIRPRAPQPAAPRSTTLPGAAGIPTPPPGAPPAGGGPAGGAAGGGGPRPSLNDFSGINGGFGTKGLRGVVGCEDPDGYKLSREERDACLERLGKRAGNGPDLGLPIPGRKQAGYDAYVACQNDYRRKQGSMPSATDKLGGQSVAGVEPLPKNCLPLKNR